MNKNSTSAEATALPATSEPIKYNKIAAVKAILYHTNGSQSEMMLGMPFYTMWLDAVECGANALSECIYELTKYYIDITAFEIKIGTVKNGIFEPTFHEPMHYVTKKVTA